LIDCDALRTVGPAVQWSVWLQQSWCADCCVKLRHASHTASSAWRRSSNYCILYLMSASLMLHLFSF